ncbi:MAG TPA: 16S rRNA (guanine(527)-N(7))-methyltransferase RsmG [bacterium]|mgnify:CR=1 FL=1|nr:16S rRNA (guanine(527)-N(7))-methyltransferase RsmG [bacterium]HQG44092.1 16S rRNA (guanine(527)-N(7))-methyltransferase RsmG [bacterium]HQI47565.1 16S rRNA (guanine(527)-N(7))-methyltransferase RsmG [bacterium]HQJ63341.1 16S rRNA (guanine(527)-N(7))-methyltransferase RsmG [bacterium]
MLPENKIALLQLANDVNLQAPQQEMAAHYVELIETWNRHTNLVSRQDIGRLVSRHLRESFWFCLPQVLGEATRVLDLGSGAGFPGVPMKILQGALRLTLLDSRQRKALFLAEVVRSMGWRDVEVCCDRAENLPVRAPGMRFELVVCRAVSCLTELWRWAEPLLQPGGRLAALKGGNLAPEVNRLKMKRPALEVQWHAMPQLTDDPTADRTMILIHKF